MFKIEKTLGPQFEVAQVIIVYKKGSNYHRGRFNEFRY